MCLPDVMNLISKSSSIRGLLVLATLVVVGRGIAEIRPSFDLEGNIWNATDIVMASEGDEIDGKLEVRKVFSGNLAEGNALTIPELAVFRAKERRTVPHNFFGRSDDELPRVLSGKQLVLFLKRDGAGADGEPTWKSAHRYGGMDVSVVWINEGRVYGFTQIMNPGDAILVDQGASAEEFEERLRTLIAAHQSMVACRALPDPKMRAKQAAAMMDSPVYSVVTEAFSLLADCGEEALPYLRKVLADEGKLHLHDDALKAFGLAGGVAVVPEICAMVEAELKFWKATAPDLKQGWWNNMEDPRVGGLRERYGFVLEAFYTLKRLKSPTCEPAVTAFRDYWRSLPQLEDPSGLDQMSEACDAVLEVLAED